MRFEWNGHNCYLHNTLATQLDSFIFNIAEDWDFVISITGDRMVRVGKSVLAIQICAYLAYRATKFLKKKITYDTNDIYFDSQTMIDGAQQKPKYHINHYDEAREALAASKHMNKLQQDLIDFFNECGQLNQIFILVLPDYFTLKEEIAVGRSECLINVYRYEQKKMVDMYGEGKIPVVDLKRGRFEFFTRKRKAVLYDKFSTTRRKNYFGIKANFIGTFTNEYMVKKEDYIQLKSDALKRFKEKKEEEKVRKTDVLRDKIIMQYKAEGLSHGKIVIKLEQDWDFSISRQHIDRLILKWARKEAET